MIKIITCLFLCTAITFISLDSDAKKLRREEYFFGSKKGQKILDSQNVSEKNEIEMMKLLSAIKLQGEKKDKLLERQNLLLEKQINESTKMLKKITKELKIQTKLLKQSIISRE